MPKLAIAGSLPPEVTEPWRKRLAWWFTARWARKQGYSEREIARAKRAVPR